ncbi:unnamed protein product [Hyaloperonospora brassicae]|uniref:RxLR effector candidate protein n=1 Tax=Hyaloperonospora brassicae TaxID=162125 RepID=A0AAV0TR83_HYABA|nr:unnamed protein product [Hyaloperonospora brassicae]
MKLLYLRALIVSGVLSAMFYDACGGSEREASAPGAHALDHETVKTALSPQATTNAEQEDRGWICVDVVPFLHGLGPAKFETVSPASITAIERFSLASITAKIGHIFKREGVREIPAPFFFDGTDERVVSWMAFCLFSRHSTLKPNGPPVLQIASVLAELDSPRAAAVLQHARKGEWTEAWVRKVEAALPEEHDRVRRVRYDANSDWESQKYERYALKLAFYTKVVRLWDYSEWLFKPTAKKRVTSQLKKDIADKLRILPIADAAIVVQVAKESTETRKLALYAQKQQFVRFKGAGIDPNDLEKGWLPAANYFGGNGYGKLVKAFVDDYKKAYFWMNLMFG